MSKYKSARWLRLRKVALQRDKYLCQECKRYGRSTPATTVHHIDPDEPGLFYALRNLVSLCDACHNSMHDRNRDRLTALGNFWLTRSRR